MKVVKKRQRNKKKKNNKKLTIRRQLSKTEIESRARFTSPILQAKQNTKQAHTKPNPAKQRHTFAGTQIEWMV